MEAKCASKIIQTLNTRFPLPDLRHLKRIRPIFDDEGGKTNLIRIIVCNYEEELSEDDKKDFPEKTEFSTENVPSTGPWLAEHLSRFNQMWPCVFHKSSLEAEWKLEQDLAERIYDRFGSDFGEDDCLIIDPETDTVVGRGSLNMPKNPLDHSIMRAIESVSSKAISKEIPSTQYLCTGFHVLLRKEPCFMCAMALVHSRVTAVIFEDTDSENGAYCSQTDCKWIRSCNHSYQVYKVIN